MIRAAVVGEALVDVIQGVPHPGGSPVNVAIGLARLGLDVTMATRIGRDANGRLLDEHLARTGVALTSGSTVDAATSTATVTLDHDGGARYAFDVVWDVPAPRLSGFDLVHAGSIGVYLEPGASVVEAAIADAPAGTLVSFDPNIRPALIGAREAAAVRTERIAAMSHVVKLSDEDAAWLYPDTPLADVLQRFCMLGARLAVATRGARGCIALTDGETVEVPARAVAVADTVGAGDAFMSGLLAALAADGGAAAIVAGCAPSRGWAHALQVALESAAITVSRPGADPPTRAELRI